MANISMLTGSSYTLRDADPALCVVAVAIQTAAMDMLGGDGIGKQCRTADIMADAAYAILSRSKDYTGHFVVDEDILKEEGVQDFEQYAVQPGESMLTGLILT